MRGISNPRLGYPFHSYSHRQCLKKMQALSWKHTLLLSCPTQCRNSHSGQDFVWENGSSVKTCFQSVSPKTQTWSASVDGVSLLVQSLAASCYFVPCCFDLSCPFFFHFTSLDSTAVKVSIMRVCVFLSNMETVCASTVVQHRLRSSDHAWETGSFSQRKSLMQYLGKERRHEHIHGKSKTKWEKEIKDLPSLHYHGKYSCLRPVWQLVAPLSISSSHDWVSIILVLEPITVALWLVTKPLRLCIHMLKTSFSFGRDACKCLDYCRLIMSCHQATFIHQLCRYHIISSLRTVLQYTLHEAMQAASLLVVQRRLHTTAVFICGLDYGDHRYASSSTPTPLDPVYILLLASLLLVITTLITGSYMMRLAGLL